MVLLICAQFMSPFIKLQQESAIYRLRPRVNQTWGPLSLRMHNKFTSSYVNFAKIYL